MELKRVVITGVGALTPIGNNANEYWNALKKGVSGAAPITHFDASKFKTQFACEVKGFKVEDHFDRKEGRKLDTFSQYALVTATEAMQDANFDLDKVNLKRGGVIWGAGIGGIQTFEKECTKWEMGFEKNNN